MGKKGKEKIAYCDECKFLGIDGGPSPVMVCDHPEADDMGYIVSWDNDGDYRISKRCPKLRRN